MKKKKNPNVWPKNLFDVLKYFIYEINMCAQFEINLTKNEEAMAKSESPPKNMWNLVVKWQV